MSPKQKLITLAGSIFGAGGIAAAAMAAHGGNERLMAPVALVALVHGVLFVILGTMDNRRGVSIPVFLQLSGAGLFCADLVARNFLDHGLLPMAAPTGGILMILGWLAFGILPLLKR